MCVFCFCFFSFPLKLTQMFTFSWKSSESGFPFLESDSFLSVLPGKIPLTSFSWFKDHRWTGREAKRGEVGDVNKNEALSQAQNIPDVSSKMHILSIEREPVLRESRGHAVCASLPLGWVGCVSSPLAMDAAVIANALFCARTLSHLRMQVTIKTKNSLDCKAHAAEIRKLALL